MALLKYVLAMVRAQSSEWHPWQPLVSVRMTQTLAQGLGARFHQVVSPRGAARTAGWRAAAVVWAGVDVAKASWLTRTDKFRLVSRLALDAADLAFWCLAARDDSDSSEDAVVPGATLAVEAGARLGLGGLVVPALNAAVAGTVRTIRGHRLRLDQLGWQVLGVIAGMAFSRSAEYRRRTVLAAHDAELAARAHRAEIEGLHEVLIAHEGPLDLLQRATALIDFGGIATPKMRTDLSGSVKSAIAEAMRGHATYLGDALAAWQAHHNSRPELGQVVALDLETGAGTVVLSSVQASSLFAWLEARQPSGTLEVRLGEPEVARRPFERRVLVVGTDELRLEADQPAGQFRLDALPAAFLLNIGWLAAPTGTHREAVRWSATLVPVALGVSATLWSARNSASAAGTSSVGALTASFLTTLIYTVIATPSMRHSHTPDGVSRYPWVMPLQGYELVRGLISDQLGLLGRSVGLAGTAVIIATGWYVTPSPRSPRALVGELGWPVGYAVFARRLRRAAAASGELLTAEVAACDFEVLAQARERGRARAHDVITEALLTARSRLAEAVGTIEPALAIEATRRLADVERLITSRS